MHVFLILKLLELLTGLFEMTKSLIKLIKHKVRRKKRVKKVTP